MSRILIFVLFYVAAAMAADAAIPGRIGIHAVRLEPRSDARDYAEPSWGGGVEADFPIRALAKWTSVAVQFTFVNLNSESFWRRDPDTLIRTVQSNSQSLIRFGAGFRIGPHGHGTIQPFAGIHGHIALHETSSTLEIPDDMGPEDNTIRQELHSASDWGLGWDATIGVHLNFYNRFGAYGGASYFRTSGINQPLGVIGGDGVLTEDVTLDPEFTEIYFGLSISFEFIEQQSERD